MQSPDNSRYGYIGYTYDIRSAYNLCISISIRFMTVYLTFQHTFDVYMQNLVAFLHTSGYRSISRSAFGYYIHSQ